MVCPALATDVVGYSVEIMRSWAPIFGVALAAATVSLPAAAHGRAAPEPSAAAAQTDEQRKAEEHFQRAKDLYSTGKYREAIAELEVARGLDPKAKDLVMNLAIVYEKLGSYDEAIAQLKTYLEMEGVTPAEHEKAEHSIKRLEGAKKAAPPPSPTQPQKPATPSAPTSQPRGRIDGLTIGAASIAVVGLGLGTGLGIYALGARPASGFVTGRDGTYATLQQKTDDAHRAANVADVALGVGVVGALAAAWLYFGRTKTAHSPSAGARAAWVTPSIGGSGGGVRVSGTF